MSLYLFACALVACDSGAYIALSLAMLFPPLLLSLPVVAGADAFFPSMFRALRPQAADLPVPSCDTDEEYASPRAPDEELKTLAKRLLAHWLLVHGLLRLSTAFTGSCAAVSVCTFSLALEVVGLALELLYTDALMLHRAMFLVLKSMFLILVCLVGKMPGCAG